MLLLSRYLAKQVTFTTILIAVVLTLIIWLTQSLRLLDFIISGNAPMALFGKMLLLTVPRFFEIILPVSLALSIIYSLNKFSADSELIIMQNSGVNPARLGGGILLFSVVIAILVFFLSSWGTPLANRELDSTRNLIKSDYSLGLLRPGVFNTLGEDTTIYIASRSSLQDLRGVFIHFNKANEVPTTITAEHGSLITHEGKIFIVISDGTRQQFNPNTGVVETLKFQRYSLDLSSLANKVISPELDPNDRTLPELLNTPPKDQKERTRIFAELHNRIARPFLILAYALMTLTPFLIGGYNRRGQPLRLLIMICGVLSMQGLFLASSSLAATSTVGLLLLYGVPFGIILFYSTLLLNDGNYRGLLAPIHWLLGGRERLI